MCISANGGPTTPQSLTRSCGEGKLRTPATDEVHVWICDLGERSLYDERGDVECLDWLERTRAEQIKNSDHRSLFVASHAMLKRVLAGWLHLSPREVALDADPGGKPRLSAHTIAKSDGIRDLRFNLSHSGSVAVIAVGRQFDIGVDVEQQKPLRDWTALAERICSREEVELLRAQHRDVDVDRIFNQIWVRKEAYAKATGEGLAASLTAVSVLPLEAPAVPVLCERGSRQNTAITPWRVHDIAVSPGYAGAVATPISRPMLVVERQQ